MIRFDPIQEFFTGGDNIEVITDSAGNVTEIVDADTDCCYGGVEL